MSEILEKAREYTGTPFRHHGRQKGVGVDCVGLVICAARDAGMLPQDFQEADYNAPFPDSKTLLQGLEMYLRKIPASEAKPGDVVLLALGPEPTHVGILTENCGIIHALSSQGKVVEHGLRAAWKARVRGYYTIKQPEN